MKQLLAKAFVTKAGKEEGVLEASVASTPVIDRVGESIDQEGWELKQYKKNPVLLWAHNLREQKLPIGKVTKLWTEGKGKRARLMFTSKFDLQDTFAAEVYRKFKDNFLNAFSVGFVPIEKDGEEYLQQELLEISAVPVPANPEALVILRDSGFETSCWKDFSAEDIEQIILEDQVQEKPYPGEHACRLEPPGQFDRFNRNNCAQKHDGKCIDVIYGIKAGKSKIQSLRYKKEVWETAAARSHCKGREGSFTAASTAASDSETKGVIPFRSYPLAQEGAAWDAGKEVKKAEVTDLKKMCAWFDSENPDLKGSYKLPHHLAENKYTVWRGVAAAMAVLLGARGGVRIPDADRKGVYNHLKKHYKEFDKEVPDFRLVEGQILKDLDVGLEQLYKDTDMEHVIALFRTLMGEIKKTKNKKPVKEDFDLETLVEALKLVSHGSNLALSKLKEHRPPKGETGKEVN